MSRRMRIALYVVVGLLVLAVLVLLGLYWAVQHEPAFYRETLEVKPQVLEKASDRMLQQIGALQSALRRQGRWQATITAEELNGWLAIDLAKNHPNTLPPSVHNPRVVITPTEMTVACRYEGAVHTVLSLTVQPYVPEPNVVALRIVRGRAGMLPVPLKKVLDGLSKAAAEMRLHLRWVQAGSDPVAMLSLPEDNDAERVVRIETLELGDGQIRVSGITEPRKP
jgi:hypothetical protein